jgi:ABC-type antimicrobial peptide transport system permease subunit
LLSIVSILFAGIPMAVMFAPVLLQLIALTLASIPYAIFYFYAAVTRRLTKISLRLAQENLFMTIIDQQRLYHQ